MGTQVVSPGELEAQIYARLAAAKAKPARPARGRRSTLKVRGATVVVAIAALTIFGAAAVFAVHDAGFVELDGNVADDSGVGAPYDWNTLFDASGNYIGPAGHQNAFAADYFTPDYTYHAGSDKDQDDVSTWQCGDVNNPTPKDEILNAYAVLSVGTAGSHVGDTILNFGFERPVNNGTSFMGVWFFQSAIGCDSSPTGDTIPFTGVHTDGDILTLVNFTNGGAQFNIQVYEWVGTGGAFADGTMNLITSSGECGPSEGDERVCGKVNTSSITTNWPPGDGGLAANQFFEGGLNINDLLAPEGQSLPCFSTFMAETRTSDVFTAQLKDFAYGNLNSCGEVDAHKYLDVNGNGALDAGEGGLTGWTIDLYHDNETPGQKDAADTLFDSQVTDASGNVTFTDVPAGDYIVCEQVPAVTPPWVNTDPGAASAAGPLCKALTVTAGQTTTTNFGNGRPNIDVTKSADATDVCAGTTVHYTITVTNNGNVTLTGVTVIDDHLGILATGVTLAAGGSATYNPSAAISADATNTVTASGNWDGLSPAASDTASATVHSHTCTIDVTKTPSQTNVCTGAPVNYTYVVTNTGDFFNVSGSITDDNGTVATADDFTASFGPLAPAGTATLNQNGVIINGTVTNTVTANGTFDDGASTTASDTASATVTAHNCTISLTKTPSTTNVCNGSSVDYTYVITNNSDQFTWTGNLTDNVLGTIATGITIAPGGTDTRTASWVINGVVHNTATASGVFNDPAATSVSTTADATVTGHVCAISLTKTPSSTDVCNGSSVEYTYVITNNSNQFTWTGDLTDDLLGPIATGISIAPGGTDTETASGVISGTVTNTATATGVFDDPASSTASDTATATVTGHVCTISLTKTPSVATGCNGDAVVYTYVVTNNSDAFTWTGSLTDDVLGSIAASITLGPGASQTFTANSTLNGTVTNTATASGAFDDPDSTAASATASATVTGHPCGAGCTPGFWQGGFGIKLWNQANDPDWSAKGGASATNPFVTTDKFSTGPWGATGNATIDNMTMLQIVGSGGTSDWLRKAARDLVAAYLNASFLGSAYPYSTATILSDWATALAGGTAGLQAFHTKYAAANELGCTIGQPAVVTTNAAGATGPPVELALILLPVIGALFAINVWVLPRRREEEEA